VSRESINLEVLATRAGFNSAVRHMNKTIEISGALGLTSNLGGLLFERGDENLSGERGALLLRMLLVDKLGYKAVSSNLQTIAADLPALASEFERWKAVDLVAAYHHPDLGLLIANPKVAEELAGFGALRRRELLVIFAGKGSDSSDENCLTAAKLAISLFQGEKVKIPDVLLKGNFIVKKSKKVEEKKPQQKPGKKGASKGPKQTGKTAVAKRGMALPPPPPVWTQNVRVAPPAVTTSAPVPSTSKGPVRMTPMYSVVVSNELFHNGNVEAWKRIIESYKAKYPNLSVHIYYDGERILDINTLFKWGKVKHGSAIMFAVSGDEIKDVVKLQRYLVQGASSRFEAFLHGPVNTVLKLFG